VLDDVAGDEVQAFVRSDNGFELGPSVLQTPYALGFLAFCYFLEVGVEGRATDLVQVQLGEATLVVDGDGGPVLDGALDV
jgi:hypothetical protein